MAARFASAPWRLAACLILGAVGGAAVPAHAFSPHCAARPLSPECCPSPCPVADIGKIADYAQEAARVFDTVRLCRSVADGYLSMVRSLGAVGTRAWSMPASTGRAIAHLAATSIAPPACLALDAASDPRKIAEQVKAALIAPSFMEDAMTTRSEIRAARLGMVAGQEALNAFAVGQHSRVLAADAAASANEVLATARNGSDVRSDAGVNASGRALFAATLGGWSEQLATWAALEATAVLRQGSRSLGPVPVPSQSAKIADKVDEASAQAKRQARMLQSAAAALDGLDAMMSDATALHNERRASQALAAQYPALQNTIASERTAQAFRSADADKATALLTAQFGDGERMFLSIQDALRTLDSTSWHDGATKTAAAEAAARTVVAALQSPSARSDSSGPAAMPSSRLSPETSENLVQILAAWLEDDKLERYLRPLSDNATAACDRLRQRLDSVNRRYGFDLATDGEARERQALDSFKARLDAMPRLAELPDRQRNAMEQRLAALTATADAVRNDPNAATFIVVRWPS